MTSAIVRSAGRHGSGGPVPAKAKAEKGLTSGPYRHALPVCLGQRPNELPNPIPYHTRASQQIGENSMIRTLHDRPSLRQTSKVSCQRHPTESSERTGLGRHKRMRRFSEGGIK